MEARASTGGTIAVERARSTWLRIALAPDSLALGSVLLLVTLLAAIGWHAWGDLDSDSGYDAVAAFRVAHGEVPYRDFIYFYGPLAPGVLGLATLLGGAGFGPLVLVGLVITAAIIVTTYCLARVVVGPLGAFLATAITAAVAFVPNNYSYVLPHTSAATLGTLILLWLLLSAWRYAASGRTRWLTLAGANMGLLTLTKPEAAVAGFAASCVWLLFRSRAGARGRRELAVFFSPALVIPILVYGSFLAVVSAHRLFLENLYPVDQLNAGGDVLVKVRMPLTLHSFGVLAGRFALYATGALALVLLAWALSRASRWRRLLLPVCGLVGALAVTASVVDPEALRHGLQYAWGWVPAGAAVAAAVVALRFRSREGEWSAGAQFELVAVVALAVVAFTSYGAFYLHAPHPQMAVYYVPLAAVFMVCLHLRELARGRTAYSLGIVWIAFLAAAGIGLTVKDTRRESATVRGPGGTIAETPPEAALYQSALGWIERNTKPGDKIFVAPLMTGLYPLSGRESPADQISILPDSLPSVDDQRRTIEALERAHVRLVLTDDRTWPGYGHTSFGGSFDRVLAAWIRSHFDRVAVLRVPAHDAFEGYAAARALSVWLRRGA